MQFAYFSIYIFLHNECLSLPGLYARLPRPSRSIWHFDDISEKNSLGSRDLRGISNAEQCGQGTKQKSPTKYNKLNKYN